MPSRARLDEFIAVVESGDHAGAIERYYTEDASMQENAAAPRVGRDLLVARERGVLALMTHKFSSMTRWSVALVLAVLIAIAVTWSALYTFQPDGSVPPALASKPSAPAPSATPTNKGPVLNGTYQLTYDRSKKTTNGIPIRHDGTTANWWAFRSVCTTNGCAATGTQLDDATHQAVSTTDGGQADTLRFVAGYWQGAPVQERVGCRLPNGQVTATQQETVAWSLAPQADGTLRAVEVQVFPEAMRGVGEGSRPWDSVPNSSMTNATVDTIAETKVDKIDGRTMSVKYKDGEKKVFVPANVPVITYVPADKAALTTGAHVIIMATKAPDGSYSAPAVNVGRDGLVPPM